MQEAESGHMSMTHVIDTPALHHACPGGRCQGTQCGASVASDGSSTTHVVDMADGGSTSGAHAPDVVYYGLKPQYTQGKGRLAI